MYNIKKWFLLFSILCMCLFTISSYAESELITDPEKGKQESSVETAKVTRGDYEISFTSHSISFLPHKAYQNYHGRASSFVQYFVKNGQEVEVGDPIMEISTDVKDSEVREVELSLQRLKENESFDIERVQLEIDGLNRRMEFLSEEEKTISLLEIEKKQVEISRIKLQYEKQISAQNEKLSELQNLRENSIIYAEKTGKIDTLHVFTPDEMVYDNTWIVLYQMQDRTLFTVPDDRLQIGNEILLTGFKGNEDFSILLRVVMSKNAVPESDLSYTICEAVDEEQVDELFELYPDRKNLEQQVMVFTEARTSIFVKNVLLIDKAYVSNLCKVKNADGNFQERMVLTGMIYDLTKKKDDKINLGQSDEAWIISGLKEGDELLKLK